MMLAKVRSKGYCIWWELNGNIKSMYIEVSECNWLVTDLCNKHGGYFTAVIDIHFEPSDVSDNFRGYWSTIDYFYGSGFLEELRQNIMITGKGFINECISGSDHVTSCNSLMGVELIMRLRNRFFSLVLPLSPNLIRPIGKGNYRKKRLGRFLTRVIHQLGYRLLVTSMERGCYNILYV